MRERSLVAFSLLLQTAVGASWVLWVMRDWITRQAGTAAANALTDRAQLAVPALAVLGMIASLFHLGTPLNAWRALTNLRSSWLSREILLAVLFTGASGLFAGLQWFKLGSTGDRAILAWAARTVGLGLVFSMANAYRLRTIPAWDTNFTPISFVVTTFLAGGLMAGLTLVMNADASSELPRSLLHWIALGAIVLLTVELAMDSVWIAVLVAGRGAALRAAAKITQEYRTIFRLRRALMIMGVLAACAMLSPWVEGEWMGIAMALAFGLVLASEMLGRQLFYEARTRHGV